MKKIILLMILLMPSIVLAQEDVRQRFDTLFGEHSIYENFFYEIKDVILSGDSTKLSEMNIYLLLMFLLKMVKLL